jgi:ABC-type uncharacterized transport system substrate-binding protein
MHASGSKRHGRCDRIALRLAALAALALLAACNRPFEIPEPPAAEPVAEQAPAPEPPAMPAPVVKPRPAPRPPPPPPAAPVEPRPVAILVSSQAAGYQAVADALIALLGDRKHRLYQLDGKSAGLADTFAEIAALGNEPLAVAIGLPAARAVSTFHAGPAVFCQVFNYQAEDLDMTRMRGVAAFAPLDLQLQAWKQMSPELTRVAAILGEDHDDLLADATAAADQMGVQLEHRVAGSDREALYVFKRLAPEIDGLWLFPDNRVLSAGVIREMLGYALRRNVQVVVFNPTLLKLGALMSASTQPEDIATTVLRVLDAAGDGEIQSIPALTRLSQMDIRVNAAVAERFGVTASANALQLVRSP